MFTYLLTYLPRSLVLHLKTSETPKGWGFLALAVSIRTVTEDPPIIFHFLGSKILVPLKNVFNTSYGIHCAKLPKTVPGCFDPAVTVIMLSPRVLALRVTSASPRNRRFTPFYCIPTYYLVSVYRPVRAEDQFDRWLNSF